MLTFEPLLWWVSVIIHGDRGKVFLSVRENKKIWKSPDAVTSKENLGISRRSMRLALILRYVRDSKGDYFTAVLWRWRRSHQVSIYVAVSHQLTCRAEARSLTNGHSEEVLERRAGKEGKRTLIWFHPGEVFIFVYSLRHLLPAHFSITSPLPFSVSCCLSVLMSPRSDRVTWSWPKSGSSLLISHTAS